MPNLPIAISTKTGRQHAWRVWGRGRVDFVGEVEMANFFIGTVVALPFGFTLGFLTFAILQMGQS